MAPNNQNPPTPPAPPAPPAPPKPVAKLCVIKAPVATFTGVRVLLVQDAKTGVRAVNVKFHDGVSMPVQKGFAELFCNPKGAYKGYSFAPAEPDAIPGA